MNPVDPKIETEKLPRIGRIDIGAVWSTQPLIDIDCNFPLLDHYLHRHDYWTDKIRLIGLDAGVLVDFRLLPGLDRLIDRIYGPCGWARPDVFVVSDIGRKGIDDWSAVSVVSHSRPLMLLGTKLIETLDEQELAFIIAHETGHLLSYSGEWSRQMSLSFLIREYVEGNQNELLERMMPAGDWQSTYRTIMGNMRTFESRCDRLGLLLCGDFKKAAVALLTVVLKSSVLARQIDPDRYLSVQYPLLAASPEIGPFTVNAGHPFMPYRLKHLKEFAENGSLERFTRAFAF